MELRTQAERHRMVVAARQAKADDIKKAHATAVEEGAHALAERARLEMEQKAAATDAKREQDSLNRKAKEYSNALKKAKRAEVLLQTSQAQLPFMRRQLDETARDVRPSPTRASGSARRWTSSSARSTSSSTRS